jgi:hypothetical protein
MGGLVVWPADGVADPLQVRRYARGQGGGEIFLARPVDADVAVLLSFGDQE